MASNHPKNTVLRHPCVGRLLFVFAMFFTIVVFVASSARVQLEIQRMRRTGASDGQGVVSSSCGSGFKDILALPDDAVLAFDGPHPPHDDDDGSHDHPRPPHPHPRPHPRPPHDDDDGSHDHPRPPHDDDDGSHDHPRPPHPHPRPHPRPPHDDDDGSHDHPRPPHPHPRPHPRHHHDHVRRGRGRGGRSESTNAPRAFSQISETAQQLVGITAVLALTRATVATFLLLWPEMHVVVFNVFLTFTTLCVPVQAVCLAGSLHLNRCGELGRSFILDMLILLGSLAQLIFTLFALRLPAYLAELDESEDGEVRIEASKNGVFVEIEEPVKPCDV